MCRSSASQRRDIAIILSLFVLLSLLHEPVYANIYSWGKQESLPLGVTISEIKGYYGNGRSPKKIVAGGNQVYTLSSDGRVIAWGEGHFGSNVNVLNKDGSAETIQGGYYNDIAVATDGSFFCATDKVRDRNNEITCYGSNEWNQIGESFTGALASTPVTLRLFYEAPIKSIHAGQNFACVLFADGAVGCWGGNNYGQLGTALTTNSSATMIMTTSTVPYTSLALGPHHVTACRADATFWAWGRNDNFQITNTSSAPVTTPTSQMDLADGGCVQTDANSFASYMITDKGHISIKGYALRPDVAASSLPGQFEASNRSLSGAIIHGTSARGGDLFFLASVASIPSSLSLAGPGSLTSTTRPILTPEPELWVLPSSTKSSYLIDSGYFTPQNGNPFQTRQLLEFLHRVAPGEFITLVASCDSGVVVSTNRGRVFAWTTSQSGRAIFGLAQLPGVTHPIRADRMGLLGSFDILGVRAAKTQSAESDRRLTLLQVFHPETGVQFYFQGYATSFPGSPALSDIQNPRPIVDLPLIYSRNDIFDVSAKYVVLHAAAVNAVYVSVWGGSSWRQVAGISGNVSFVQVTNDTGYAVVSGTQVWSWPMATTASNDSVAPTSATRIDTSAITSAITSFKVGPYGNVFVIDSANQLFSFGNNLAPDGRPGILCQRFLVAPSTNSPALVADMPPVAEIHVNGDAVYALSANRSIILGCGNAAFIGINSQASIIVSNFTAVALPPGRVEKISAGYRHAHAVLSDGSIFSWGWNAYNQTATVSTQSIVYAPLQLQDPNRSFAQRELSEISSGYDFTVVSSRLQLREANQILDPAATTVTISGTSISPTAYIELIYPEIEDQPDVACSVITASSDGSQVACLPYFPESVDSDVSFVLYEYMVSQGLTQVSLRANIYQQDGLESTHISVSIASIVLPTLQTCEEPCQTFTITSARQLTLQGERFGSSPSDVSVVLAPSGVCVPITVTPKNVTCQIQGILTEGPLYASVFRNSQPALSDIWVFRFVLIRMVKASPSLTTSNRQIPWNARTLTLSGSNLTTNSQVYFPSLDVNCPVVSSNGISLTCNLASISVGPFRGPLEALVRLDGGASETSLVSFIVSEPRSIGSRDRRTKLASNIAEVQIDCDNVGSSLADLSVSIFPVSNGTKRSALNVDCSVVSVSSTSITCRPTASLPIGETLNATITRASGQSAPFFLGTSVAIPTVSSFPATLAANAFDIVIKGSGFFPEGTQVTISTAVGNLSCLVQENRSSQTDLVCSPTLTLPLTNAATLSVVSFGGAASFSTSSSSITIVGAPSISFSSNSILDTARTFEFISANIDAAALATCRVFLTLNVSAPVESLIPCTDLSLVSNDILQCRTVDPLRAATGSVYAIVTANYGRSNITQIGVLVKDSSFLAVVGAGGVSAIAVAAAVLLVVLVILIVVLIRKKKLSDTRKRNAKMMLSVPDDQRHLFNIRASDITVIKKLGEGSFGAVYLGKFKRRYVAVKKLAANVLASQVNDFFRESALMLGIPPNPYVVRQFGMCQEMGNLSMVMEFLPNGSLDSYLTKYSGNQLLPEETLYRLALGIARGMAHLAANRIVHRDLAARNILLDSNMNPKVSDFGFSRVVGQDNVGKTSTTVGPVRWMCPEAIGKLEYSEKSDVWSFGCVLYEIAERREPYEGEDLLKTAVSIRDFARNPMADMRTEPPEWFMEILRIAFEKEPEERPTFDRIISMLESSPPTNYVDSTVSVVELPLTNGAELLRAETTRYMPIQIDDNINDDPNSFEMKPLT